VPQKDNQHGLILGELDVLAQSWRAVPYVRDGNHFFICCMGVLLWLGHYDTVTLYAGVGAEL
jgi:hypothetical protein